MVGVVGNLTLFFCKLLGKITSIAPLDCSASKAVRFRAGREGMEAAEVPAATEVSLNWTLLSQTLTWSEMLVRFRFEESPRSEEQQAFELVVEFSELPRSREISACGGNFLINFSGRKQDSDLGFPKY